MTNNLPTDFLINIKHEYVREIETLNNIISIKEVEIIITRNIEEEILGNIITSLESVTKIHDQDMENITNSINAIKSKLTGRFLQICEQKKL